jgi:hypothetical protein
VKESNFFKLLRISLTIKIIVSDLKSCMEQKTDLQLSASYWKNSNTDRHIEYK